MEIYVEYLLPFDSSNGVCSDEVAFLSLIGSNSNISIKKSKHLFVFSDTDIKYSITWHTVEKMDTTIFNVKLSSPSDIQVFKKFLRTFRSTIGPHVKSNIQILWNGISFEWCKELYPKIYETENQFRKLISKFMLENLGMGWYKKTVPQKVHESIKNQNYRPDHNILYQVDFIQLSTFMFSEYTIKPITELPDLLKALIEKREFTPDQVDQIQDYIPISNWDRYFKDIVKYESEVLKGKWEALYEIRCIVAHNNEINEEQYDNGINLCKELSQYFNEAIHKMTEINIPENRKELISLKTINTAHYKDINKGFINEYFNLNNSITSWLNSNNALIEEALKKPLIDPSISSLLNNPMNFSIPENIINDLWRIENDKNNLLSSALFDEALTKSILEANNINEDLYKDFFDNVRINRNENQIEDKSKMHDQDDNENSTKTNDGNDGV
jgi:hypothetical protein